MHKVLVIRVYFPLATFISCTSHLVYAGISRYVWLLCGYSHTTATRMVPAYTKCDVQLIKVANGK